MRWRRAWCEILESHHIASGELHGVSMFAFARADSFSLASSSNTEAATVVSGVELMPDQEMYR